MPITAKGHKMLAAFHGLDPEKNNDDDVAESIKKAVTPEEVKDLKNRAKAGDDALISLVDEDLKKYGPRIGTDAEALKTWKDNLLKNRAGTIKVLEAIPAPVVKEVKKPIHNRAAAGSPAAIDAPDQTEIENTRLGALIKNRANELQKGGMNSLMAFVEADKQVKKEIEAGLTK